MLFTVLFSLICNLLLVGALQPGDRISTLIQTLHSDMKTQWTDIPLNNMPHFGKPESVVLHANIPKYKENSTEYQIDPTKDVKVALSFDGNKLMIPWIPIYEANMRRTMRKLVITFTIDEFEIIRLRHSVICKLLWIAQAMNYSVFLGGPRISKVDPTHPSLRGFEIDYRWESVQEEDFGLGVVVLFGSATIGVVVLFFMVVCCGDVEEARSGISGKDKESPRTPGGGAVRKGATNSSYSQ